MDIATIRVESAFGMTIEHPLYQAATPRRRLMILLPGRGYQVEHPALYYSVFLGLQHGFDVLPVCYGFQWQHSNFDSAQTPLLLQDVNRAAEAVLARGYDEVCIVGKSLGTPVAVTLAQSLDIQRRSLILLTPIPLALQALPALPTLAVIGTTDSFYTPDLPGKHPAVQWHIVPDVDHGFIKAGDWQASIQAQQDILQRCDLFLKDTHP